MLLSLRDISDFLYYYGTVVPLRNDWFDSAACERACNVRNRGGQVLCANRGASVWSCQNRRVAAEAVRGLNRVEGGDDEPHSKILAFSG